VLELRLHRLNGRRSATLRWAIRQWVKPRFRRSYDSPRSEAFSGRKSIARATGLHTAADPLDLNSAVVLVLDQDSGRTLYEKNANAVLPIASITKLMTAMVVLTATPCKN